MMCYFCVKDGNDDILSVHSWRLLRADEKNFYRHVSSLNWFRDRELKRRFPDGKAWKNSIGKWCSVRIIDGPGVMNAIRLDGWDGEIAHHEDLYELYEAIGYDRKKKRFLKEGEK